SFLAHQDYPWLLPGAVAQALGQLGESRVVPAAVAAVFGSLTVAVVAPAGSRSRPSLVLPPLPPTSSRTCPLPRFWRSPRRWSHRHGRAGSSRWPGLPPAWGSGPRT